MRTHVTVLGWLFIVWSGLGLLAGLFVLVVMGGIGALAAGAGGREALPAAGVMGGLGTFIFAIIAVLSLPGLLAGWGLLNYAPWARILTIVLCILNLFSFPLGTAIGIYGLVVLFSAEGAALFDRPPY